MMESAGLQLAWRKRLGLFLLLLLLSAAGVFDHSLWSNDAREGAMIAEMVRNNTWTTPTFNGVAYLEKPPLMHWTAVLLCRMTGRINASMTRLPAALYGFAAMLLVVAMAREMDRERSGWLAAFMCATSALYFEYSRVVLTDTTLAFMVMLALFIFWRAWRAKKPAIALHITFMVVAALSFYAKGLLGPGLIWVTVCIFLALQRAWKRMLILPLVFVPIFLLTLLPWTLALYRVGGMEFLNTVFWANQFGRFLTFTGPDLPVDPYLSINSLSGFTSHACLLASCLGLFLFWLHYHIGSVMTHRYADTCQHYCGPRSWQPYLCCMHPQPKQQPMQCHCFQSCFS